MSTVPRNRYRYECGTGSWHQRKAGHYVSGILIVDHSKEEHETFLANMRRHGQSVVAHVLYPTPENSNDH